jgi:hypothetical protein
VEPKDQVKCDRCEGKKFINRVDHDDGGSTFEVCECTGITNESLKAFAAALGDEEVEMEIPVRH